MGYCHSRDRGTEVEYGTTPDAGNPGNDATWDQLLGTKRDIHTMGDSTSPTIVSVTPVHQETGTSCRPVFEIVFNEDIQAGTGNVIFESESSSTITFDIAQANTDICASSSAKLHITLSTFTADFSPCNPNFLSANTKWYVKFAAGVMKDDSYAANEVSAFGSSQSYYFTTTSTC